MADACPLSADLILTDSVIPVNCFCYLAFCYAVGMNDEIRAAVKARLKEKGLTQADLARATGKHPNAISRTLNGHKDGGKVPEIWAAILEALDLRLTVEAGQATKPGERGKA